MHNVLSIITQRSNFKYIPTTIDKLIIKAQFK